MEDKNKTKKQLLDELASLRQQVSELVNGDPFDKQKRDSATAENSFKNLAEIVNRSPAIAFLWKAEEGWPVEYVSDNVQSFGYAAHDFLSGAVPFATIVHPDDLERVAAEVAYHSASGDEEFSQEYRIITRDNEVRYIDDRTLIKRDSRGEITHFQGIVLDITEQKKTLLALNETEKYHKLAQETANLGNFRYRIESDEVIWSANLCKIVGLGDESLITPLDKVQDLIHPEDLPLSQSELRRVIAEGGYADIDIRIIRPGGETCYVHDVFEAIQDEDGQVIEIIGTVQDITERKQIAIALQESEKKYRDLVENSPDVIFKVNTEGSFVDGNDAFLTIGGYQLDEIIGQNFAVFVHPDDFPKTFDAYQKNLQGETTALEIRIRYNNGEYVWYSIINQPTFDVDGNIVEIQGIARDINQRMLVDERNMQQAKDMALLKRLGNAIIEGTPLSSTLAALAEELRERFSCTDAALYLVDNDKKYLILQDYSSKTILNKELKKLIGKIPLLRIPLQEGSIFFEVLQEKSTCSFSEKDAILEIIKEHTKNEDLQKLAPLIFNIIHSEHITFVPLIAKGEYIGILSLLHPTELTSQQRERIELVALQTALVIQHKQLIDDLSLFKHMTDEANYGVGIANPDGSLHYCNTYFAKIHGYEVAELRGKNLSVFHNKAQLEHVDVLNRKALEDGRYTAEDVWHVDRDGREFPMLMSGISITSPESGDQFFTATAIDTSERMQAELKIKTALAENEILLKEIHHRVKNNLYIVSSLLDFQAEAFDVEQVRAGFQDIKNRIMSMARVHEHLYQSDDFANVEMQTYIQNLAADLVNANAECVIDYDVQVAPLKLKIETAIPCGLIISELVSNSLRHAFPSGGRQRSGVNSGNIIQILLVQEVDWIKLTTGDNGIGLPAEMDLANPNTLGLRLIGMLTRQLEGSFELDRTGSTGTTFTVTFPVSKEDGKR